VALWVSAFEILARDEGRGDGLGRVRQLLSRVQLQSPKLRAHSSVVNTIYKRLWIARNEFLHGNPVTAERLKLEKCKKPVLWFAAPLFRLALTAFLDLRSPDLSDTSDDQDYNHIAGGMPFSGPQRLAEDAILKADEAPDQRPPAG
jgi:hypothetical protein